MIKIIGNPAPVEERPIIMLKSKLQEMSLRKLALEIGCSAAYLSDVMRGQRYPGPKILKYLGLRKVVATRVMYEVSTGPLRN